MIKVKRNIVAVVGGTVLTMVFALVVLPGSVFLVIPAGLAILAMESAWARRWLRKARGLLPENNSRGETGNASIPTDELSPRLGSNRERQRHAFAN